MSFFSHKAKRSGGIGTLRRNKRYAEMDPDQVLIDSSNLPRYDTDQFEGRLEKPIGKGTLYAIGGLFAVIGLAFLAQAWQLQIVHGQQYLTQSQDNTLRPVPIFASRGVIYDRNGAMLAWNAPNDLDPAASSTATSSDLSAVDDMVPRREYATTTGLAAVLGYVQYPSKDKNGFYYQDDFEGIAGAEQYFNGRLQGNNGSRLVEVDASGRVVSQNVVEPPAPGQSVTLSIDSRVTSELYHSLQDIATNVGYQAGAGVIMDVRTGEIIALTSYPEYSPQVMSDRTDTAEVEAELNDPAQPFLNRAVDGLFTPGSIVKPYEAMGALNEHIIDPTTIIDDTGEITVPNPYDPGQVAVFKDWKAIGDEDMYRAIAMSSDVYFYTVGGGYGGQKGLGVDNIDKYFGMFGLGEAIPGDSFVSGPAGVLSSPAWKEATFGQPWYLGDTYHTAIGQYGTLVTPAQMARAVSAMANEGTLLIPTILDGDGPHVERTIDLPQSDFAIVHEGMRQGVEYGTSVALNVPFAQFAGKSGTAELGATRQNVNSWITGFWPYDNPEYAFAVTLDYGSVHETSGAAAAMRETLLWMGQNTPEYFTTK